MGEELLGEFTDLLLTMMFGYIGAIEVLYVIHHLYHWSCDHEQVHDQDHEQRDRRNEMSGAVHLENLKDCLRQQLVDAKQQQLTKCPNVMRDGVMYDRNGFRLEELQHEKTSNDGDAEANLEIYNRRHDRYLQQREEQESQLKEQQFIYEKTLNELVNAEDDYLRMREQQLLMKDERLEEREREHSNTDRLREKDNVPTQQRSVDEEELVKEKNKREDEQEFEYNERHLIEEEKKWEIANQEREQLEEERTMQADESIHDQSEKEMMDVLIDHINANRQKSPLPAAKDEGDQLARSRKERIEENARLFLEAEKEMVELQGQMLQRMSVMEKPYVMKTSKPLKIAPFDEEEEEEDEEEAQEDEENAFNNDRNERVLSSRVKTQLSQYKDGTPSSTLSIDIKPKRSIKLDENIENYLEDDLKISSTSSISSGSQIDDSGSIKDSKGYNFEDSSTVKKVYPGILQRDESEEFDNSVVGQQFSEEYLRSLDGIKGRPLMREDGSGRRRAFKKRRSSGSSNSSRDSRQSREEELKMFTSLEEEEFKQRSLGEDEFTPIRYSSEPSLKVKGHHHRRHKRSPNKSLKGSDDNAVGSLESLSEETLSPWSEVGETMISLPSKEHLQDVSNLCEREEEEDDSASQLVEENRDTQINRMTADINLDKMAEKSSFEEATQEQNEQALNYMKSVSSWHL